MNDLAAICFIVGAVGQAGLNFYFLWQIYQLKLKDATK